MSLLDVVAKPARWNNPRRRGREVNAERLPRQVRLGLLAARVSTFNLTIDEEQ